ncbi:MAG: HNH endonuclease [Candidatus Gastranaerophilales bacterium]|nr:HNH endonuclease [Candidatus Gastranaerophilales bacterium]
MEQKLGRLLEPYEDVHHIDGDPSNNNPDNLCVELHVEHEKKHNPQKYSDKVVRCCVCNKEFILSALQQKYRTQNRYRRNTPNDSYFCSKRCSGLYGKSVQQNAGVSEWHRKGT